MSDTTLPPVKKDSKTQPTDDVRFLQPEQILLIDHALEQVGQFGEVRLIVEKGKLRFIEISQSMDVTKLQD
ncbi:MAG TPA: hypothetical protein PLT26_15495 [Anaerolineaceae bacterium]|nr:hypothetical protein [Anaerolineaceae bacterium]HQH86939.1 hypothetical protein [Anaerolineaceae bacterium]